MTVTSRTYHRTRKAEIASHHAHRYCLYILLSRQCFQSSSLKLTDTAFTECVKMLFSKGLDWKDECYIKVFV